MRRTWFLLFCLALLPFLAQAQQEGYPRYEGQYNGNGQRHGQGTYYWDDSTVYTGRWERDLMHGKGTLTLPDKSKYEGSFLGGQKNGFGTFTWANGDVYMGGFLNNMQHGRGTLKLHTGGQYEGEWVDGKHTGKGTFTWPDGSKYIGEWKDNLRHGAGVMLYADGRVEQGSWSNDKYIPCRCAIETQNYEQAFQGADAVVVGKVFLVQPREDYDVVGLQVQEYWKGKLFPGRKIYLRTTYTSCDFPFFEGEQYLIYGKAVAGSPELLYQADKCTRSHKLPESGVDEEVKALRKLFPCKGDVATPQIYDNGKDEVCGCDGNTYRNPYDAQKAGVQHWTAGPCPK